MPPTPKKGNNSAFPAETALTQLRSCLVNLPAPLANVLVDANILVQNVVIEISWKQSDKKDEKQTTRSIYVGWTGMRSKQRPDAVVTQGGRQVRQPELLEIDSAFAKLQGLEDGTRVGILLHSDVPQVHTVSIDPLTPADWEIIEMHPEFLEANFLPQVRALPNPSYKSSTGGKSHPLILHLSATSTASVLVTALRPAPPSSSPFAKISGSNAEVIVAPKSRQKSSTVEEESTANSIGAKSGASSARSKGTRPDSTGRPAIFLRGVDRAIASEWFDEDRDLERNTGLKIWIDWSVITSKDLRGFTWVWVSVVGPSGLQATIDEDTEALKPASRIVAQVNAWEDAPNPHHVALSSELCAVLSTPDMAGDTVRIEVAPPQISKSAVRSLRIHPFASLQTDKQKDGLRFGSKTKTDHQEAAQRLLSMYTNGSNSPGLLDGPITDGMVLLPSATREVQNGWQGGILKFYPQPGPLLDSSKSTRGWILGSDRRLVVASTGDAAKNQGTDRKLCLEVMGETAKSSSPAAKWQVGGPLPSERPNLVGIDSLIERLASHLKHSSSTLITGGRGAGKTSVVQLLGHALREQCLSRVIYFPCRSLVTDETRVTKIKETLSRVFGLATWGARFCGHSLVILDDIDLLCPSESELEVGNDNARHRHISEVIIAIARQHCGLYSRVVLLATAQSKEAVHNDIISGHVVQEIVHLSAPDKETRRKILQAFVNKGVNGDKTSKVNGDGASDIDFLDIAGRADGFMPGDLLLLESRARSESLIRTLASSFPSTNIPLMQADLEGALQGFTPTSLRNVTLQHSTTTFSSIGGLKATRQILMETLQYPTLYAPIFAKCPLRLRSGLLLYGYPGCGKTLLASAVAGECGLNFISVKGPEILNKYIGASEKSVRDLFERAQAARPCVLFFDEFDSVAPKRGHDATGVTDRVVNQLLTQMDGAEGLSGVYVLAATSRPDLIDPALLRPGRLDKSLECSMPDMDDRADILAALSSKLKVSPSVHPRMRELAERTGGFTGADLQALVYNAHLEAIHDVLGDRDTNQKPRQKSNSSAEGPHDGDVSRTNGALDFSHFRMREKLEGEDESGAALAHKASERAQIMQALVAHRAAQQRARRIRRESVANDHSSETQDEERVQATEREPVIEWVHFERALDQTRPSISREEVRRLGKIYGEFVASRNGEMPNGQGGNEVGGRTSLV